MLRATIIFTALLALMTTSCQSVPPIIDTEGPGVVQYMVKTGTRWALAETDATVEEANRIRGYLIEARGLLDGEVPVAALDELAAFLNTKIENELVRRAVNQGAQFVKENLTIPGDIVPENYKRWVYAVLDGGAQGCAEYAALGADPRAVPTISAPDKISFR